MIYTFKTITLHNFMSYEDATIDLLNKGYCLIKGINNSSNDKAKSNGAGKSTIASAITFCLCGVTIQGYKSVENNLLDGGCFVTLDFSVDEDEYQITRYKNYGKIGNDLKIIKNGKDESGKGIKSSSEILLSLLPELTINLLSSVIILGQGLPNSFTKKSPRDRKELLENLTGTDYMIVDIKKRLEKRMTSLEDEQRTLEDNELSLTTTKNSDIKRVDELKNKIEEWQTLDFLTEINKLENEEKQLSNDKNTNQNEYDDLTLQIKECQQYIVNNNKAKFDCMTQINNQFKGQLDTIFVQLTSKRNELSLKIKERDKMLNVKEFCPTCGQKLSNVIKFDPSNVIAEISQLQIDIDDLTKQDNELKSKQKELIDSSIKQYDETNNQNEQVLKEMQLRQNELFTILKDLNNKYNNVISTKNNYLVEYKAKQQQLSTFNDEISKLTNEISSIETKLLYNKEKLDDIASHKEIITKMQTYSKRDFRGYLLNDIIVYLESRAKEYCNYIFNTNDLVIQLNDNDVDILFQGKEFEGLSGGEKQKLDIIIQFAIRDMMSNYLNFSSNVIFLDEITDNLDEIGCNGLFELITEILIDVESLFIISHHESDLALPIDTIITVEKNASGISRVL